MDLSDTSFVVVDTETTGVRPATERIIEIAAVRVVGGEVVDTYSQLINPDRIIPGRITQITGISNSMVYEQPFADRVLPEFLDFLGDDVFVAHNLGFDLGFINAELARLDLPGLANPSLCTLRLARRLLRGLRSKGLTAVAAFYGIKIKGRHRALGDATATATILGHFLQKVQYENEVENLDDLLRFQYATYVGKTGTKKNLIHIKQNVLPELPRDPGVYFMRDGRNKIIYVGKAKNLRSRVKSYFNAIEGHETKTRNLVDRVANITWETFDTELQALLEESRLIKELKPRFNKAQKFYRNRPFIKVSVNELFPRASLHTYLVDDGADYFGPVATRRQGELLLDLINRFFLLRECDDTTFNRRTTCLYQDLKRCKAPCERSNKNDWYDDEVERVKRFLRGEDGDVILEHLDEAMRAASIAMDYEQAALYRDHRDLVSLLLEKQSYIASPVLEHNAIVVDNSIHDSHVRLLFVCRGRLVETLKWALPLADDREAILRERIATHFIIETNPDEEAPEPTRYFKAEIEEIRLLAHWLYVNREASQKIDWQQDTTEAEMVGQVMSFLQDIPVG
ncbi:MAG: DEDD exonuclease domain-containing protein [Bacteroidota bacterium]